MDVHVDKVELENLEGVYIWNFASAGSSVHLRWNLKVFEVSLHNN